MQEKIDEATARKIIEEADARRAKEAEDARLAKRDDDRRVVPPNHFHATVYTFAEKEANGSMKDSTHHETLGLTVEAVIRKARNRAEPGQGLYHLGALSECTDPTHGAREFDERGPRRGRD